MKRDTQNVKRSIYQNICRSFKLIYSTWAILPLIEMALSPRFRSIKAMKRVALPVRVKTIDEIPHFFSKIYTR